MPETSAASALEADTAEADEGFSECCVALATKYLLAEVQSKNKRNITGREQRQMFE